MVDPRDKEVLEAAFLDYQRLISRPYLQKLSCLQVKPCTSLGQIRILQINTFPTSETQGLFTFVLNALAHLNCSIGYILKFNQNKLTVYLGLESLGCLDCAIELLTSGLHQTFPTLELNEVTLPQALIDRLFHPQNYNQLGIISLIPNNNTTTPLLSQFTKLMGQEDYLFFILCTPNSNAELNTLLFDYSCLYSTFSPFAQSNLNYSMGLSHNGSTTITHTNSDCQLHSSTNTDGSSNSWNHARYFNFTPSTSFPLQETRSLGVTLVCNKASGDAVSLNNSCAQGESNSCTATHAKSVLNATNKANNEVIAFSENNKEVANILVQINAILERLEGFRNTATFNFCSYILASKPSTGIRGAYTYLGLAQDPTRYLGSSGVNLISSEEENYLPILAALQNFCHPSFLGRDDIQLNSTTLISSLELINTIYFPFT